MTGETPRRPAHEFHALWYSLGPYGPQDVHVHPCSKDGHGPNDEGPRAGCSEVLLGYDRQLCSGKIEDHERADLENKESVERAAARLREHNKSKLGEVTGETPRRWTLRGPIPIKGFDSGNVEGYTFPAIEPPLARNEVVMPVSEHQEALREQVDAHMRQTDLLLRTKAELDALRVCHERLREAAIRVCGQEEYGGSVPLLVDAITTLRDVLKEITRGCDARIADLEDDDA